MESIEDTDGDGIMNYVDEDSDGDGISDADEAGDADLATPPADCGDDFLPDFRDTDSDNDGVADAEELSRGTGICDPDSDDDGVTDLVEIVYGSDPLNPGDSPRERGDFVFIVPYMENPDPDVDTLVFSTNIQHADVFFMVDTTGSMGGELDNLQSSLTSIVLPGIAGVIPDTWYGVGGFDDYPVSPYGSAASGDRVFYLEQRTTASLSAAQNAVNRLSIHYGADNPESNAVALWAIATGGGLGSYLAPQTSCGAGEFGYPCFRSGSVPIVIMISDAMFHNGPSGYNYTATLGAPAWATTVAALVAANIKVIGVHSDTWSNDADYRAVATATGAVDSGSNPLVYNIPGSGTGLGTQLVNAVRDLANHVPIEVSTSLEDVPTDAVDARIFVDRVEPNTVGGVSDPTDPTKICVGGLAVADRNGDTFPDVFTSVLPGTTVCFDIYPEMNTTVPADVVPQIFECLVHVVGDGITILDTRSIFFLVPALCVRFDFKRIFNAVAERGPCIQAQQAFYFHFHDLLPYPPGVLFRHHLESELRLPEPVGQGFEKIDHARSGQVHEQALGRQDHMPAASGGHLVDPCMVQNGASHELVFKPLPQYLLFQVHDLGKVQLEIIALLVVDSPEPRVKAAPQVHDRARCMVGNKVVHDAIVFSRPERNVVGERERQLAVEKKSPVLF
jgi:hypothetical protein